MSSVLNIKLPADLLGKVQRWRFNARAYGRRPTGTASFLRRFTGSYKTIAQSIINQLNEVADAKKAKDKATQERGFIKRQISKATKQERTVSFKRSETTGNLITTKGALGSAPNKATIEVNTIALLIGGLILLMVVI